MQPTYATTVLSAQRLDAIDAQLASMEVSLNLLRFAPGDGRGSLPWSPLKSPAYCREVAAALALFGCEIDEDDDGIDNEEVSVSLQADAQLLEGLHRQCERLRRVLALSEEVLAAVGGDAMALAFDRHIELQRIGRAGSIHPVWGSRSG